MKTPFLLLFLAIAATAVAEIKPKHITGTIVQRYYPNPNLKLITHLLIYKEGNHYLVVDHANFPNLGIDEQTSLWAVPGMIHERTGRRIHYYVSQDEPSPDQLQSIADAIWAKYRDDISGNRQPTP
jgi:hypothetical protein